MNTQLRPVTFSCSLRELEGIRWVPLFTVIYYALIFMPSTGLNAVVAIMNKATSPPAVKLQNLVEGSKEHELSATPAVWTVNLGNGRRCLPSPLPQAPLLHHCPSLWDIGCLGCSAPSSDCTSKRSEWVASHRVLGLSDSPQHGKNPRVPSWHCQVSSDPCFPPVVTPPAPSPPAPLTTLTKRGGLDYSYCSWNT